MTKQPDIEREKDHQGQEDLASITNKYHQVLDEVKAADLPSDSENGCFVVPSDEEIAAAKAAARKALDERMTVRLARMDTFAFSEEDMERIAKERQAARDSYSRTRSEHKKEKKQGLFGRAPKEAPAPVSAVADRMDEPAFSMLEEDVHYDDYAEEVSEKEALVAQVFSEEIVPAAVEVEEEADQRLDQFMDRVLGGVLGGLKTAGRVLAKASKPVGSAVGTGLAFAAAPAAKGVLALKKKWGPGISEKIGKAETFCARKVDAADEKIGIFMDRGLAAAQASLRGWNNFRRLTDRYKAIPLCAFACIVVILSVTSISEGSSIAYEYRYNGNLLGVVKDPRTVEEVVDLVGDRLGEVYDAEITLKKNNFTFTEIRDKDAKIDSSEDVLTALTYMKDLDATAYALCVNGEQKAVLESKEAAESILEAIKTEYTPQIEGVQYLTIGFAEDVSITEVSVRLKNVDDTETVMEQMLTSGVEQIIYTVQSGDTFSGIASKHEMTMAELEALNPEVNPNKLYIGDELIMNQMVPQITVQTTEIAVYNEDIPFDVTYEETGSMYQGETRVKAAGVPGQREVTAEIVRNNGMEVGRTELGERLLSEPTSQIVLKGTKEPPPLIGTGTFQYPARGRLSSNFGSRWGRQHEGIDIAAAEGTDIRAADGGRVIYSGWAGALGYCVKIDHGGNMTTVYGHCSKLLVSVGEKVYKDQLIAKIGNTGRSTGPHVHFEIRKNGVAQNPLKYL